MAPPLWRHEDYAPEQAAARDASVRALEGARAALAVLVAEDAVGVAAVVVLGLGRARQQVGHDDHRGRERERALAACWVEEDAEHPHLEAGLRPAAPHCVGPPGQEPRLQRSWVPRRRRA